MEGNSVMLDSETLNGFNLYNGLFTPLVDNELIHDTNLALSLTYLENEGRQI